MKHTLRSPITGRFIAKRTTGADLVEEHNRTIRKRRLWDLLGQTLDALALVAVGASLTLLILAERGVR